MNLKSFDINLGFNGEASTASVTVVGKVDNCGSGSGGSNNESSINSNLSTGNSQIDNFIKDFIINKKEESIQAGFKEIKYQLIDKQAKKLSSIAVLVRGITAGAKQNPLKSLDLIYDSSEKNSKGGYSQDGIITFNAGRIAVIGKAFSEISVSDDDKTLTRTYNRGSQVAQTPTQYVPPLPTETNKVDLSKKIEEEESISTASIRYGYYLGDLKLLIEQYGYSISGFPSSDRNLILDFGGSLKDCISSVANMFGLYYICRGNKITFYTNSQLQNLQIPNFTTNNSPNILSASYSEDVLGKQTVGVIKGFVNPKSVSSSNTNINYGNTSAGKTVNFYRVTNEDMYLADDLVSAFFTIFKLGGSEELFDRIVLRFLVEGGSEELSNSTLVKNYFSSNTLENGKSSTISAAVSNQEHRSEILKTMSFLSQKSILYSLKSKNGQVILPSKSDLFPPLKGLCEIAGGLYVSQSVSSKTADGAAITPPDGLTVSQPYKGDTALKEVKELASIVALYKLGGKDISNKSLYSFAKEVKNPNDDSTIGKSKFYYIAQYDFLNCGVDVTDAAQAVKTASQDLRGTVVYLDGVPYFAISSSEKGNYTNVIKTSKALWKDISKKIKGQIRAKAFEHKAEANDPDSPGDEEPIEYPASWVSFIVRGPSDDVLCDVSVTKFEGSIDEASYLESQFNRLISQNFNSKTSSVTYSGLQIPSDSPNITSVSVQFSGGSVQTTIEYSNSEFRSESNEVIMSTYSSSSTSKILRSLTARQKNALGLN